jgi:hypothetical protein
MFISLCLSSFHSESSDHSLGPVEAKLRSAGRVGAPAPTCASMAHACGSIHMELAFFLALFSRALNLKRQKSEASLRRAGGGTRPYVCVYGARLRLNSTEVAFSWTYSAAP